MRISITVMSLLLVFAMNASAVHFDFDTTDANCSVLIRECYLMTGVWDENDEIGLFTASGVCGGSTVVVGFPLGIAAWADDALTDSVDEGFHNDDSIYYKRWDASEEREIDLEKLFVLEGESAWNSNGLMIVELAEKVPYFEIQPTFVRHRIKCSETDFYDGDAGFQPAPGSQAAILTPAGIIGGLLVWPSADSAVGWAYQDDPLTEGIVEGFEASQTFAFRYWDSRRIEIDSLFLEVLDGDQTFTPNGMTTVRLWNEPVSVEDHSILPAKFEILGAHPNPFNGKTSISVAIPRQSSATVTIFSSDGRQVNREKINDLSMGIHTFSVDMNLFPSGNYLWYFESSIGSEVVTLKLIR